MDESLTLPDHPVVQVDRKLSVVSVSTTISTRTEPLQPKRPSGLIGHRDFIGSGINGGLTPPPPTAVAAPQSPVSPGSHHSWQRIPPGWPTDQVQGSPGEEIDGEDTPPHLRGLLLLAEMSSEGNMMTPEYTASCVKLARKHRSFVMGFVAQRSLNDVEHPDDNFLTMTPGVSLPPAQSSTATNVPYATPSPDPEPAAGAAGEVESLLKGDGMGQQYRSPRKVVLEDGVDVVIVGRAILQKEDWGAEAERFRSEAWRAYEERISKVNGTGTAA